MKSLKSTIKVLVPVIMILALVIGCAPQSQPAATPTPTTTPTVVKPKEFTLYSMADLSGPYASLMRAAVMAHEDYWGWLATQGGVDGVKINYTWLDTQLDKTKSLAAYTKIRETNPRPFMCVLVNGTDVEALHTRVDEDKIVTLTVTPATSAIWPPAYTFSGGPSYEDCDGAFIDWLSADWAKSGENRKCRLALFNPDIPVGRSMSAEEMKEYIKTKPNIEVVSTDYFDYAALDLSSDILKVMQNKPDYLYGFYFATSGAAMFRSLDSSGFRGKVKIASAVSGMQPEINLQVDKKFTEGTVGPHYYPTVLPLGSKQENAGVAFAEKMFTEKNRPKEQWGSSYVGSMGLGFWMTELIRTGVKEVGWDKINGENFYKAVQKVKSVDCGGIMQWGLAGEGKRTNGRMRIFRFNQDGFVVPITDFVTAPDLRPAKYRTAEYGWTAAGWPAGTK